MKMNKLIKLCLIGITSLSIFGCKSSPSTLKEKYADLLSPIRQAGNSLTLRQNFSIQT